MPDETPEQKTERREKDIAVILHGKHERREHLLSPLLCTTNFSLSNYLRQAEACQTTLRRRRPGNRRQNRLQGVRRRFFCGRELLLPSWAAGSRAARVIDRQARDDAANLHAIERFMLEQRFRQTHHRVAILVDDSARPLVLIGDDLAHLGIDSNRSLFRKNRKSTHLNYR